MFIIEKLPDNTSALEQRIQAVAAIEALIQPMDAWSAATLTELLTQDSCHLLLAAESGVIKGYCLYQILFEQAEILRIGTRPNYQRQGIAAQVFAALHTELMNNQVDSLLLEVRADNAPAIALYEQQQFTVIHKRKGYYQLPHQPAVDALIMQRVYH